VQICHRTIIFSLFLFFSKVYVKNIYFETYIYYNG